MYEYPKKLRLVKRAQFLAMRGPGGAKVRTPWALLVCRPNGLGHNRLGVTVTKKNGPAALRNRFKRLAREFFRTRQASWPQGFDVLVIAQGTLAEAGRAAVGEALRSAEKRLWA